MTEKHKQQQFRQPNGFRGKLATFIANIHQKHIAGIGKILGTLIFILDIRHRRIVRRNLKFIYPDWTPSHIKKTSQRVFQNIGITVIEIYQMIFLSEEEILNKVQIKGEHNYHNALKEQKGVILISAHLGNWEIMPLYSPLYFKTPIAVVARQIRNNIFNRWLDRLRTRFGNSVIDKEGALPEMTRILRQNKILGIMLDQGTKSSLGVKITFFNKFVTATPAAVLLAMRCKSPVLPVFCTRNDDGILTIAVEPALSLERTNDLRADLKTNTQLMMDAIEKAVREYPEQWFWVHKRWKKYYPNLYPEDMAKRRRRKVKKFRRMQSAKG
jgi:KDO2-lipid IV(A) lauroyltransferase